MVEIFPFRLLGWSILEASPQQPSHRSQHSSPAEKIYPGSDFGVVLERSEARKDGVPVVLNIIGIAGRNQWQNLGTRVGHVACGVEPVFEKEEQAERKGGHLPLVKEVRG